ncbi:hypothetical protein EBT31_06240 [bacterium]|nr:hypothetical protein [bacterium]
MDCPVCAKDPTSHSFKRLGTSDEGTVIMYTKPAEATKYWDCAGILYHYDNVLAKIDGTWAWIFDAEDFSYEHMFEVNVAIGLARLISTKYSHNLQKITVVNPSFMVQLAINIVMPFLNKRMRELVKVITD